MNKIIITLEKYVEYEFDADRYTEDEALNIAIEQFNEEDADITIEYNN